MRYCISACVCGLVRQIVSGASHTAALKLNRLEDFAVRELPPRLKRDGPFLCLVSCVWGCPVSGVLCLVVSCVWCGARSLVLWWWLLCLTYQPPDLVRHWFWCSGGGCYVLWHACRQRRKMILQHSPSVSEIVSPRPTHVSLLHGGSTRTQVAIVLGHGRKRKEKCGMPLCLHWGWGFEWEI